MPKPHTRLRVALGDADLDQSTVAEKLNRTPGYVSRCMCGHSSWTLDEIYSICDMAALPYSDIPMYFPRRGLHKPVSSIKK